MIEQLPDDQMLKSLLLKFQRSEEYCRPFHERGFDNYARYRAYKDPNENPFRNNVFDKLTFTLVEAHTSFMMQTMFAVEPFLSVNPVDKDGDPEVAQHIEKCLATLNHNPDREMYLEYQAIIRQRAIMGTTYAFCYPIFDLRPQAKKSKKKSPYYFDGIGLDCQEFMDVFPDPAGKRLSRCRWCFRRSIEYWDELKELEKGGVYRKIDKIKADESNIDDHIKERLNEVGISSYDNYWDKTTGRVEILDFFQDGHVITIGARKCIIRDSREKNKPVLPYDIPLIDDRFVELPGEFFGLSMPEILADDQDYINQLRSATLDNVDLIINKVFTFIPNSTTSLPTIVNYPGARIPVSSQDDIRELQMSEIHSSVYEEMDRAKMAAQDAVGELELGRGLNTENERTATGIMSLQQASMSRRDIHVKNTEFTLVRMHGKKAIQMIRQFMPKEQFLRIIGEDDTKFYDISLEDIFDLYDVVPVGSSVTANRELRIQQIQEATDILYNIPPDVCQQSATPFNIDLYEVTKTRLESLEIKNIDELIPKVEQDMNAVPGMEGMQGQQQPVPGPSQDQLMQAMQGGGAPPMPIPIQQPMPQQGVM